MSRLSLAMQVTLGAAGGERRTVASYALATWDLLRWSEARRSHLRHDDVTFMSVCMDTDF